MNKQLRVAIITKVAMKSSNILAKALINNGVNAQVFNMRETSRTNFKDFDYVFSYGSSCETEHNKRLNKVEAVRTCVNKPRTFDALQKGKAWSVPYVMRKSAIPKSWDWVTIRDKADGRKAEGIQYCENIPGQIPDGVLFTEYFEHRYEYRIMVFKGEVVGRYFKAEKEEDWYFNIQPNKGFEIMDDHCIRAAKAIGIDYVGFDVVANNKKDFRILEANSAPAITDEAENAIVSYFINL